MGVRVRLTRNTSACFPFWLAIPIWILWLAVVAVVMMFYGLWKLIEALVRIIVLAVQSIAETARNHRA
jgi:hypothetical protein